MKNTLVSFLRWCRRYVSLLFVAFLALFVYVLFFNENSYSRLSELNSIINERRAEIKQNRDTMIKYHELNRLLQQSPQEMERIVRETYGMQREGEDVYIVKRK